MATIIAGNQNKIPPELDASYRDICINANGHKITLSLSGSNITANGIAFAHGVVGYYKNEIINDASNNGYVYVTLTTNQDEDVEDSTEIFFSSVVLTELTPNISTIAGTYRMLVATITDGSITYQNKVEYPKYAVNADVAERVTGTIASNTKATTQPTSDNSTKVATTAFVKNAIESYKLSDTLTANNINTTENIIYNRLGLCGIKLKGTWTGSIATAGAVIAVVKEGFRPETNISVPCWFTFNGLPPTISGDKLVATVATNGNVTLNGSILNGDAIEINCVYLAA